MRKLAWITGAGGLIGSYFISTARAFAPDWEARGLTRSHLDLTDAKVVREEFHRDRPQLIIHCAALSKVPDCHANPQLAWQLNVDVTKLLAELAEEIPFYFFSTDLVFDGRKGNYNESDAPNPVSVYGETKVAAEEIVLKNPKHTVIRTSMNCGRSPTGNRGFSDELCQSWGRGETTRLFTDEFRCPMFAAITCHAVWKLVEKSSSGIFHIAGSERLSRLEIGELLAAQFPQWNPRIEPGSLADYKGAPRAPDTSMNCEKAQSLLSFSFPGFSGWLKKNAAALG